MYQLASRFNHSCRANAAYHFKPGGTIVVRTLVDVETDQEICVSYLDPPAGLSCVSTFSCPSLLPSP